MAYAPCMGARERTSRLLAALTATACLSVLVACSGTPDAPAAPADPPPAALGTVTAPAQPASGPGGSDYPHDEVRVSQGGTGVNAWYAFEPAGPAPASAPLAVITHGYFSFSGYEPMRALIEHTVRQGTVVIYPRWQIDAATPCAGPDDFEKCMDSEVAGIRGALRFLTSSPERVQPETDRTSYFGFSFGGILTTNLVNRHQALGLPEPRAVFLDDPHDGGLAGPGEPTLDDDLSGIPSSTFFLCHSGARGVIHQADRASSSCNAVFPKLTGIPVTHKALVMTHDDLHGLPALSSVHGVCTGPGDPDGLRWSVDAYDWNFCWRAWDALRAAGDSGDVADAALEPTPENRSVGSWSDGTPVRPLTMLTSGQLTP